MGLTIHYALQAEPGTTYAQTHDTINSLQQCALSLLHEGLLAEVSEVLEVTEKTLNTLVEDSASPWKWAAVQSSVYIALGEGSLSTRHKVTPIEGYLFRTWPGPGSEEANFGLMRYPERIEIDVYPSKAKQSLATGLSGWHWSSFCKTTTQSSQLPPILRLLPCLTMLLRCLV